MRAQPWAISSRITHNPDQCGGRPCICGMRIRVQDILELHAAGQTSEQILADGGLDQRTAVGHPGLRGS